MGGHCVLLVADTKHNTIAVIDFMRGGYEKEIHKYIYIPKYIAISIAEFFLLIK